MARSKFPRTLGEFNTFILTAIPYLVAEQARLLITLANITALNLLYDDPSTGNGWLQIWPLTQNRATSTGALRDQRNLLRKSITTSLRAIFGDLPESALTEADRNTLRIYRRDITPTARGPITSPPYVSLISLPSGKIRQRLRVATDASRASRHPLADGWERVMKIGGPPPANPDECPIKATGSAALSTFDGGMENDGLRVYAFVRWININNPANSSGWSSMAVATISAGTVGN